MYCRFKLIVSLAVFSMLNIASATPELNYLKRITNYCEWLREYHNLVVDKFISKRENWTTSILGDVLFKFKKIPHIDIDRQKKTFEVLFWKYRPIFDNRFMGDELIIESLESCSVSNCNFHNDQILIHEVDAVVIPISGIEMPLAPFRKPWQRWIFFTEEPPPNGYDFHKKSSLYNFSDKFNWSMTYRSDSDIPIPYGRTIPLEKPVLVSTMESLTELIPNWDYKTNETLVAVMISDCHHGIIDYRQNITNQLKEFIDVDFYGACGDETFRIRCPGQFKSDCLYLSQYYFYLALENYHCRQYVTKEVFHNAYLKGAIPIIKGPPVADCEKLLPPRSFLHIDNFKSVEALAKEIVFISENVDRLLSYHLWRAHFNVTSEGGSTIPCRVCEALNYNSKKPSIYADDDIQLFLDKNLLCDMRQELQKTKLIVLRNITKPW